MNTLWACVLNSIPFHIIMGFCLKIWYFGEVVPKCKIRRGKSHEEMEEFSLYILKMKLKWEKVIMTKSVNNKT